MPDRPSARPVPPWAIPLLPLALVALSGATGGGDDGSGGSGGGGFELGSVALLLVVVIAGAAVLLAAGYLVLRWRAGPAPAEVPGEWWTCAVCGAANIADSPRCHACGAWPR